MDLCWLISLQLREIWRPNLNQEKVQSKCYHMASIWPCPLITWETTLWQEGEWVEVTQEHAVLASVCVQYKCSVKRFPSIIYLMAHSFICTECTCLVNISNCAMASSTPLKKIPTFREDQVMCTIPVLMARSTCRTHNIRITHARWHVPYIYQCMYISRCGTVLLWCAVYTNSAPHLPCVVLHECREHFRHTLLHSSLLIKQELHNSKSNSTGNT